MQKMIDMEAVIKHFGQTAVINYTNYDMEKDDRALQAIAASSLESSHQILVRWFEYYKVFQGFKNAQRDAVAKAVMSWADRRDLLRRLDSVDALSQAHEELMKACVDAFGRPQDFTSLASKALWLCYPNSVPIFDGIARRALDTISNLEPDIPVLADSKSRYKNFVNLWKPLYEQCSASLQTIEMAPCRYPVRIFDAILLCVGKSVY